MGSLFTSFNVGVSGLHAAQSGLYTTSHNLANVKTPGYTRQQNMQADKMYQVHKSTDKGLMQIGLGTKVDAIRQIRDHFLDKEYRLEVSRLTFYDKQYETVTEIEDVLGEMEGVEFNNALTDMWAHIQSLSTDPSNVTERQLFISGAESFINKAYDVYTALSNYQTGLNLEISKQVDKINEIGEKIAKYNLMISQAEASGLENANDYRDDRNLLLDELAEYTYYVYEEDIDGKIQVYINNAPLVIEGNSYHMKCEQIDEDTPMYKPVWADNGYGDVYRLDEAYSHEKKTDTGSLLGLLTARGNKFANYLDMPVKPDQADPKYNPGGVFNQNAYELDYKKFSDELKVFNNTTGNSILTKIETQFDVLIHNITTMINDILCPNSAVTAAGTGTDANGNTVNFGAGDKVLDVTNCLVGTDDEGTIGEELFARKGISRYNVLTVAGPMTDANGNTITQETTDANGKKVYKLYVYNEEDPDELWTQYSIRDLEINDKILANYSILPVKENPLAGHTDVYSQQMYTDMLSFWNDKTASLDPNILTVYKYDDYYDQMVGALGTQGSVWYSILEDQIVQTEGFEDKRQQIAGVSTDEELVSLLQYQHAFNAASRYINTIDEMLQHIIERLA